jgi:hypothetical protein
VGDFIACLDRCAGLLKDVVRYEICAGRDEPKTQFEGDTAIELLKLAFLDTAAGQEVADGELDTRDGLHQCLTAMAPLIEFMRFGD